MTTQTMDNNAEDDTTTQTTGDNADDSNAAADVDAAMQTMR